MQVFIALRRLLYLTRLIDQSVHNDTGRHFRFAIAAVPHTQLTILAMRDAAEKLLSEFDVSTISVFSTNEQTRTSDDYFLGSGDKASTAVSNLSMVFQDTYIHDYARTTIDSIT